MRNEKGQFIKGHIHPDYVIEIIRKTNLGRHHSIETKKKMSEVRKGKKPSKKARKKMSDSGKDKVFSDKHKKAISKRVKELWSEPEYRAKMKASNYHKNIGDKSHLWKGGITSENMIIRSRSDYKEWRKKVFERDNYTCVWCGVKSGNGKAIILHADHIKSFAYHPELRFEISNGRTLCKECHKKTDTWKRGADKIN